MPLLVAVTSNTTGWRLVANVGRDGISVDEIHEITRIGMLEIPGHELGGEPKVDVRAALQRRNELPSVPARIKNLLGSPLRSEDTLQTRMQPRSF
jgi:hypothetical protein